MEKHGKTGYTPAYSFDWNEYLRHKASGGNFHNFNKKKKIPLTRDVIKKHLIGAYFIYYGRRKVKFISIRKKKTFIDI
jgi:hypothetical protein